VWKLGGEVNSLRLPGIACLVRKLVTAPTALSLFQLEHNFSLFVESFNKYNPAVSVVG
jgi:hypothetical protein